MKPLNKETAKEILHTHMQNQNLRRHCYAVGFALAAYYDYYKSTGRDVGKMTKEQWEITGMLHDADWEECTATPAEHTKKLVEWLADYDVTEDMLNVFKSHNTKMTYLRDPQTLLEWTLECCDELTGFIVAVALLMPSKSLADVNVERVIKRFKQKEFARAVDRAQITQCEQKVSVSVPDFVGVTLKAMQANSVVLGL